MKVAEGEVAYGIDGGFEGIYDGVIVWVLTDGRHINRFRGEGSRREQRIDALYPKCERGDREVQ